MAGPEDPLNSIDQFLDDPSVISAALKLDATPAKPVTSIQLTPIQPGSLPTLGEVSVRVGRVEPTPPISAAPTEPPEKSSPILASLPDYQRGQVESDILDWRENIGFIQIGQGKGRLYDEWLGKRNEALESRLQKLTNAGAGQEDLDRTRQEEMEARAEIAKLYTEHTSKPSGYIDAAAGHEEAIRRISPELVDQLHDYYFAGVNMPEIKPTFRPEPAPSPEPSRRPETQILTQAEIDALLAAVEQPATPRSLQRSIRPHRVEQSGPPTPMSASDMEEVRRLMDRGYSRVDAIREVRSWAAGAQPPSIRVEIPEDRPRFGTHRDSFLPQSSHAEQQGQDFLDNLILQEDVVDSVLERPSIPRPDYPPHTSELRDSSEIQRERVADDIGRWVGLERRRQRALGSGYEFEDWVHDQDYWLDRRIKGMQDRGESEETINQAMQQNQEDRKATMEEDRRNLADIIKELSRLEGVMRGYIPKEFLDNLVAYHRPADEPTARPNVAVPNQEDIISRVIGTQGRGPAEEFAPGMKVYDIGHIKDEPMEILRVDTDTGEVVLTKPGFGEYKRLTLGNAIPADRLSPDELAQLRAVNQRKTNLGRVRRWMFGNRRNS